MRLQGISDSSLQKIGQAIMYPDPEEEYGYETPIKQETPYESYYGQTMPVNTSETFESILPKIEALATQLSELELDLTRGVGQQAEYAIWESNDPEAQQLFNERLNIIWENADTIDDVVTDIKEWCRHLMHGNEGPTAQQLID